MTRAQSAKKNKKSKILISCRVYSKNQKKLKTQIKNMNMIHFIFAMRMVITVQGCILQMAE
jgi:hypothetical protein